MTGGHAVILGATGRNFGAGMSGGIAYVLDDDGSFASRCNMGMIELDALGDDEPVVLGLIEEHYARTNSVRAKDVLASWGRLALKMKRVIPTEYKRVLASHAASSEGQKWQTPAAS
jgi:glutamate synthase domain-containing protein 3